MNSQLLLLVCFFVAINLAAFVIMLVDKNQSRRNGAQRISEGMMFFLASAFGSAGVLAGMILFHHKTQKWYFVIGIPLVMIQNVAFLWLAYVLLNGKLPL